MTASWTGRKEAQAIYNRLWGSGFLPSKHQGVALRSSGDPVLFLSNPAGVDAATRRRMLDSLARLNQQQFDEIADPETQARIAQYEMAFRMQSSVPELMDLSQRTQARPRYLWAGRPQAGHVRGELSAGATAGRARRAFRADLPSRLGPARQLAGDLPNQCRDVDQPCYALIRDLEQRGLLDDTLVVWGGEFGRTIYCQGKLTRENYGRDHHPRCFTVWMAGGGIKGGISYGQTDDFSYNVVENPVHIHDMNATILHCLGIDHRRLTFKVAGIGHAADRRGGVSSGQRNSGLKRSLTFSRRKRAWKPKDVYHLAVRLD